MLKILLSGGSGKMGLAIKRENYKTKKNLSFVKHLTLKQSFAIKILKQQMW